MREKISLIHVLILIVTSLILILIEMRWFIKKNLYIFNGCKIKLKIEIRQKKN